MQTVTTTVGRVLDIYEGLVLFESGNTKVPAKLSFKLAYLKDTLGKTVRIANATFQKLTAEYTVKNDAGKVIGYDNTGLEVAVAGVKEEEIQLELPSLLYKEVYEKEVMLLPQKLISALYPFITNDTDQKPVS